MDLKTKAKTINLLEENIGKTLYDLGVGEDLLDGTPKNHELYKKIPIHFTRWAL